MPSDVCSGVCLCACVYACVCVCICMCAFVYVVCACVWDERESVPDAKCWAMFVEVCVFLSM